VSQVTDQKSRARTGDVYDPTDGRVWDGVTVGYRPRSDWRENVSESLAFHEEFVEDLDPVSYEVLRNRLFSINVAHGRQVTRVSGSPVFATLDFNMSILTEDGEIVQNAPYIQFLNGGAPYGVRYVLENLSEDPGIEDGDVFLMNDPWIAAIHQMDVLFVKPVFVDGKVFGWVSNAGHQYDLGGVVPGGWPQNAVDVFHDPTIFTPLKIVSRGEMRKDLERMYLRNSRMPEMVALDLRAQISGCMFASERLREVCEDFGAPVVKAAMRQIIGNAEEGMRKKLQRIPDGTWTEVRYLDHALPEDRATYRLVLNVTKRDDRLVIDNHGSDPQPEAGPLAFPFAGMVGSVTGALSVMMVYEQLFSVGGASRLIEYDVQPGLMSCAEHPIAVSASVVQVQVNLAAMQACLSRMLACDPELARDAVTPTPDFIVPVIAGVNDRGEGYGQAVLDLYAMGDGARQFKDGVNTKGPSWSPLASLLSVESVEQWYPLLYLYRKELMDSGGPGRWRGGVGVSYAFAPYRAASMAGMSFSGGQTVTAMSAPGLFGGLPSPSSRVTILEGTDVQEQFAAQRIPADLDQIAHEKRTYFFPKQNAIPMTLKAVMEGTAMGGGGYGDPLLREPGRVAEDVRAGYVSAASASQIFGVIVKDGDLDEAATDARRKEILDQRSAWDPVTTGSSEALKTPATGAPAEQRHEYLVSRDEGAHRVLACRQCDQALCDYTADYKQALLHRVGSPGDIPGGGGMESSHFLDVTMEFREFCCPGCHVLMTTEILPAGTPSAPEMRFATPQARG
jgi:N-methylhydantoinase B